MRHSISVLNIPSFLGLAGAVLVLAGTVRADALNEDRILRKAGGIAEGKMTNVRFSVNGGPIQNSFDRTGKVRIPVDEGPEQTKLIHGPSPDPEFNTLTKGRVTKADVLRLGKLVSYAGTGFNDYFDDHRNFRGGGRAHSAIRGSKVISSGDGGGSRVNTSSGNHERAFTDVSAKGNF